jgi:hypothetical protein
MMLSMLFMALVGDLIFLPAILSGPAGRLFSKKKAQSDDRRAESSRPQREDASFSEERSEKETPVTTHAIRARRAATRS